ncbi:conserved hypothetical protein (plasmid) [Gluconacetobacter diazotrophicus PA1 5]|uniref:hypothetical protein n=1 Tax=Gluconacetobacter diazotrophicus TaxID=33996 RepID=UPI000173D020|nr:hypothetical protein [Gluconacetobacter diazotrophicus]ACI53283.1 conserved hypothetical protein [Gluconacetobacter diazotrophicus PA1 5]TWB00366.1 hypothetical protein FBZ86_13811 [Gluconacetobacter diazotrophicus]
MYVSVAKAGTIVDSLSTREKSKEGGGTLLTSDQPDSAETGHAETESVSITLSQAAVDALNGTASQNTPASMQLAMSRMDQIIRSGNSAAKADAGARVANLQAQMRQLMETKDLMSPKALAAALALMARELAAAVSEYVQCGGSAANAAIGTVVLSASADTSADPSTAAPATSVTADQPVASVPQDATQEQSAQGQTAPGQSGQQTQEGNAVDHSSDETEQTAGAANTQPKESGDDLFAKAVKSLAEEMKSILNELKNKKKKDDASEDHDLQSTQGSLDRIDQMIGGI